MKAHEWIIALSVTVAAFGADTTYKGYLSDKMCASAGKGMVDGADLKNKPEDHTVACEVACAKSGYGLIMKDGATYKFVPFSGKGNELASSLLKNTTRTKDMYVEVTGYMKQGSIDVKGMKETNILNQCDLSI